MRVVDPAPSPDVEKQIACSECGARLAYVPKDVKDYATSCMGDTGHRWFIECPLCKGTTTVRSI
jgi:hypothetical protein